MVTLEHSFKITPGKATTARVFNSRDQKALRDFGTKFQIPGLIPGLPKIVLKPGLPGYMLFNL